MKYITWKLVWDENNYGYGPEPTAAENGCRLEASQWLNPEDVTGVILGYLHGDMNVSLLSSWEAEELTQQQAINFAKMIDSAATVDENGIIISEL